MIVTAKKDCLVLEEQAQQSRHRARRGRTLLDRRRRGRGLLLLLLLLLFLLGLGELSLGDLLNPLGRRKRLRLLLDGDALDEAGAVAGLLCDVFGDGLLGGSDKIAATTGERKALGVLQADVGVQVARASKFLAAGLACGLQVGERNKVASGMVAFENVGRGA